MPEKFIVRPKNNDLIVISLRISETMKQEFDTLAGKSDYSRNQIMCMALQYALDNLQFIPESKDNEQ